MRSSFPSLLLSLSAVFFGGLVACAPTEKPVESDVAVERDVAVYDRLQSELDRHRTAFLGKEAQELVASKNSLYWLEFPSFAPTLHRYEASTDTRIDFGFGIGSDHYNFRASEALVTTAENGTGKHTIYDARRGNVRLDETTFAQPSGGVGWWAYAVDGTTTYVVTSETSGQTKLHRWELGKAPVVVTTFEAAGIPVGTFFDFGVVGHRLVLVESGRLWTMDLTTKAVSRIQTDTEVGDHVAFSDSSVLFTTRGSSQDLVKVTLPDDATGVDATVLSIRDAIRGASYTLNPTFASAHLWTGGDFTEWQSWIIYIGGSGVFAYDTITRRVVPVLLEPRGGSPRITYRYPVALTNGSLFVTGLTSESGSVGAAGPIYRVELTTVLQ